MTFEARHIQQQPIPSGLARLRDSTTIRTTAATLAEKRAHVETRANGEENDYEFTFPAQFTKGLPHNGFGAVDPRAYRIFVNAINTVQSGPFARFDVPLGPNSKEIEGVSRPQGYTDDPNSLDRFETQIKKDGSTPPVRSWESPRAGHVYDLQGPDSGAVGLEPAPRLGSDELTAEMAEGYAMSLLRDVPFTEITKGSPELGPAGQSPKQMIEVLNALPWFDRTSTVRTSFSDFTGRPFALTDAEARRRQARFVGYEAKLSGQSLFRGSTCGAKSRGYVSQFLLVGSKGSHLKGQVSLGAQSVSQKVQGHAPGLDYMCDWNSWLDVQNGADMRKVQTADQSPRFVTTPRDLASYVRIDALYQAYLTAALILQSYDADYDDGFPSGGDDGATRASFATFGDPHLLAVMTEVSSRALKAVRRQKFCYHRRCRPERVGGLLTLAANAQAGRFGAKTAEALRQMHLNLDAIGLTEAVARHNADQIAVEAQPLTGLGNPDAWMKRNLLLPMAYAEGSPMHPSYGSGHATVAGACVTVLKAFFQMFKGTDSWSRKTLADIGMPSLAEPSADGKRLVKAGDAATLTLEGELDKLAANISMGRNMAGVHFYSDYYDSLRLGERVAVGILQEQMLTYPEATSMRFHSFDGDEIEIHSEGNSPLYTSRDVTVQVNGRTEYDAWLKRHVSGAPGDPMMY